MANWYGAARTNYFPVKDAEAFKAWAERASLRPFQHPETGLWGVYSEDYFGGWPSVTTTVDGVGEEAFDIIPSLRSTFPTAGSWC